MQELQMYVEELARSATMHAQQHFNVRLDYSRESVSEVEKILSEFYDQIPHTRLARLLRSKPDFQDIARIANSYGAYLGEVIRREFGGAWEETEICGCDHILVLRLGGDFTLLPTTKTWNRLTMGPSENVVRYYQRSVERASVQLGVSNENPDSAMRTNSSR